MALGTGLSFAHLSPLALELVGLPGQLLMRTLKMLVLPLITASVMSGAPLGGGGRTVWQFGAVVGAVWRLGRSGGSGRKVSSSRAV